MHRLHSFRIWALSATLIVVPFAIATSVGQDVGSAESKLVDVLKRAPSRPNAIAYVHFPSLNQLMSDAKMSQTVSGTVDEVWLVSDLDLAGLRPRWEAGYATLLRETTADQLASSIGGYTDTVAGQSVVWSPKQTYFVPLPNKQVGFLRPADRATLADWIHPGLMTNYSGFLDSQAAQPESYLSLMIATDIQDYLSPAPIAQRLASFTSLKAQKPDTVAGILASVKGLSIIVGRRSLSECILMVEFDKSPSSLLPIANELLHEILQRNGTEAAEVLTWKVTGDGNKLSFQGPISEDSLFGLLNIFSIRSQAEGLTQSLGDAGSKNRSAAEQMAYTSKHYFDTVQKVVDQVRKHSSSTTGGRAKWNDQRARQIDELGTLNVDPSMIDYGSNVAGLLRNNALTIRSGNIQAGQVKAQQGLYSGDGYGYGYGYYNPNTSTDYQRVTDAQAQGAAYADYTTALNKIDQLTVDIRRSMTDKYKTQF